MRKSLFGGQATGPKIKHRVLVPKLQPLMTLDPREAHHLQVLRLGIGDPVRVFDGAGAEATAEIVQLEEGRAVLKMGEALAGAAETPFPLTLAIALLKGDKLADVVRAATELGVCDIKLLVSTHADVREIGEQKLLRLRRVAEEAAKQSRRTVIPSILAPIPLASLEWQGQLFVAQPNSTQLLASAFAWSSPNTILTGPEGGLSDAEVIGLVKRGATAISLGPRILRAETAPVALLGAIAAFGL